MARKISRTNTLPRIAVTGMGAISSLGSDLNSIWNRALQQEVNVSKQRFTSGGKRRTYYFHKANGIEGIPDCSDSEILDFAKPWRIGRVDEDMLWAILVARLAIRDAKLQYDPENNDVGLFVVHENPGLEVLFDRSVERSYRVIVNNKRSRLFKRKSSFNEYMYKQCEAYGYTAQTFVYLYTLGKALSTHGFSSYVANACASGIYAIEAAAREIRNGTSSSAVVLGIDHPRYLYKFLWFEQFGFYAPDGLIKPFDKHRNGFCLGDGAAALVLENMNYAKRRGARIYAEYLGGGFGSQSWKITLPNTTNGVYERTMSQALSRSGLCSSDIDLINVHGVGTKVGDAYEANAIAAIFGQSDQQPLINALKPLIGHTLGGSALLETVLTLLGMQRNIALGTLNLDTPDSKLDLRVIRKPTSVKLRHVMKIASGFAGFDAAAVFRAV